MEAKAGQNASRRLIIRMMPGIQRADIECREGVRNDSLGSFAGKAAPPAGDPKLKPQLVDALRRFVRLKPAAADVLPGFGEEDRPILNAMLPVVIDLPFQTRAHLLWGKWATG
jgi:hypothetical protein